MSRLGTIESIVIPVLGVGSFDSARECAPFGCTDSYEQYTGRIPHFSVSIFLVSVRDTLHSPAVVALSLPQMVTIWVENLIDVV